MRVPPLGHTGRMGAPRQLSSSLQLELFGPPSRRRAAPRAAPPRPHLRAHRYLEGDASSIRVGNEWLEDLLVSRECGWVIELSDWLRLRLLEQCHDSARQFPQEILRCEARGARPLSPVAVISAIFVGTILGINSLRELERAAAVDLRFIWILGGMAPDHSTFGRWILRMQGAVSEQLFEALTVEALRAVHKVVRDASLDGTTIQAATSRYGRLCAQAVQQQLEQARAELEREPADEDAAEQLAKAQARAQALATRQQARRDNRSDPSTVTVCPSDPEAVVHKLKEGNFAPAVVASVIATEDRFVVAAHVHPSDEIASVAPMLQQAEHLAVAVNVGAGACTAREPTVACARVGLADQRSPCSPGARVTLPTGRAWSRDGAQCASCPGRATLGGAGLSALRMDGNYLTGSVLRLEQEHGVELHIAPGSWAGSGYRPQGFDPEDRRAFEKARFRLVTLPANDYAPERTCMQCPMGALLPYFARERSRPNDPAHDVYRAGTVRCSRCPYKSSCAPTNPRRRVARYGDDELKERMRDRHAGASRREQSGQRARSVEPVFSVVKGVQRLRRFRRRGLRKAQLEWHLHLIAHNLRRMMSLRGWLGGT